MTIPPSSGSDPSFADQYAIMSDSELLAFAKGYDSLIDSAQAALRAEFAHRHLEPPLIDSSEAEPVSRNLVTLRRYRDLSEAIVARGLLESAGIFCFLMGENLVRLDWQVSNFIGGIRLQVPADDARAATELLDQPAPDTIDYEGATDYPQPHCPRCQSTDITFDGSNRKAALASLYILGLPLPKGAASWLCNRCDYHWTDDPAISGAETSHP